MAHLQPFSGQLVSKSWCHTDVQVVNFSFLWTINGFSYCREKTGEFLQSTTFPVGSEEKLKWSLRMYPRGERLECKDYVSLHMELVSCDKPSVHAVYEISILNARQEKKQVLKFDVPRKFSPGDAFGSGKFVQRSFLLDKVNALLRGDRLALCCDVSVVLDYCSASGFCGAATHTQDPDPHPVDDLGKLFETQRLSDVVLVCDSGQEFAAHKAILAARSPVFAAMFEHDMREKEQNRVKVSDMEPRVLQGMLRFMYMGKTSDVTSMPEDLLKAADGYAVDGLKKICEEYISSNLSAGRAAEVLVLADLYNAGHLKANVIDFIHKAVAEVMMTAEWKSLFLTHPHLVAEVLGASKTQLCIF